MVEKNPAVRPGQKLRLKVLRFLKRFGFRPEAFLVILGCLIGALTGVGSVGFTRLIEFVHGICYGREGFEGLYSGRMIFLVILPAVGALFVGLITYFFAREAKGHGVPEVMDAIARRDGRIRPRVALAKAVSSALTIGSGGSAGTEGPIIQIGAALGSAFGQFFKVANHNMPVLVGCGAAAGISAIFHAPIAGVLFALEIFLRQLNFRTFSPVLMASVTSSVVVKAMLGSNEAIFPLLSEQAYHFHWFELGNYVVLGLICAFAAVWFVKMLYGFEDFFEWVKVPYVAKPVIGAVALGGIGIVSVAVLQETPPSVFGNGYPLIGRCLEAFMHEGTSTIELSIWILLLLFVFKVLATCFTLGSGGSGGIFAPSLFMGAVVGYAFGLLLQKTGWFSADTISPASYALVGMAAVVAATTHAPMTAIIILFEMTRNYQVILPIMFSATVALGVAQLLYRDSIYTLKLRRRGIRYETLAQTAILRRLNVRMVMQHQFMVIYDDTPLNEVIRKAAEVETTEFIVVDHSGQYHGMLTSHDLRSALLQPEAVPFLVAGELARTEAVPVSPDETLDQVLDKFSRMDLHSLPVHNAKKPTEFIGMITRADLMRRYQQELQGTE
ncbi:MAG: chloride channel protein [Sedimentisphaerales bacterium]|nr:chloride channel protein [Sedimentisphaerales bacterium]